jgi:ABC-2 type transport system ATP-binding protein
MSDLAVRTHGLTKRFGSQTVVDRIGLEVPLGAVYGFLGPNGSGKTTTIRMILGLVSPTSGGVEIFDATMPREAPRVLPAVGSLVEGPAFHPYLSGRANLHRLDAADRTADRRTASTRVDAALDRVGLLAAATKRYRAYSLGMRQRLAIAGALLTPKDLLVLDEPTNGLDPQGTREVRQLVGSLADDGATVLVSSHLLAEAAQTVDDVVVINRGRLAAKGPVTELTAATSTTRIRTPDAGRLMSALGHEGITAGPAAAGTVEARGADPDRVARIAASAGVIVLELTRHTDNLEELFFDLVSDRADDRTLEACPS